MGILDKLFKRQPRAVAVKRSVTSTSGQDCLHTSLTPRWDDMKSMGSDALASGWQCAACYREFSPAEAEQLRATEAERISRALGDNAEGPD